MRTVTIQKSAFVEKVTSNRADHRATFEAAIDGYRRRMVQELEDRIDDLKAGRQIDRIIRFEEPEDHTRDYDQALLMAEMSVDETLELTNAEFTQYIMDDWGWKQNFMANSSQYTS